MNPQIKDRKWQDLVDYTIRTDEYLCNFPCTYELEDKIVDRLEFIFVLKLVTTATVRM